MPNTSKTTAQERKNAIEILRLSTASGELSLAEIAAVNKLIAQADKPTGSRKKPAKKVAVKGRKSAPAKPAKRAKATSRK